MIFRTSIEMEMRGGIMSAVMAGRSRGVIRFNVNFTPILVVRSLGRLGCSTDSSCEGGSGMTDFMAFVLKFIL